MVRVTPTGRPEAFLEELLHEKFGHKNCPCGFAGRFGISGVRHTRGYYRPTRPPNRRCCHRARQTGRCVGAWPLGLAALLGAVCLGARPLAVKCLGVAIFPGDRIRDVRRHI